MSSVAGVVSWVGLREALGQVVEGVDRVRVILVSDSPGLCSGASTIITGPTIERANTDGQVVPP
jgi:hypothetical protein